jgi:hypothetical protein
MRNIFCSIAALAIAATVATSANAARSNFARSWDYPTIHCSQPGGACVGTSANAYNSCVDLGLERGFNLGKGDRYNLDRFVYQCLAGRVPR